jgi:hypothetical protein
VKALSRRNYLQVGNKLGVWMLPSVAQAKLLPTTRGTEREDDSVLDGDTQEGNSNRGCSPQSAKSGLSRHSPTLTLADVVWRCLFKYCNGYNTEKSTYRAREV